MVRQTRVLVAWFRDPAHSVDLLGRRGDGGCRRWWMACPIGWHARRGAKSLLGASRRAVRWGALASCVVCRRPRCYDSRAGRDALERRARGYHRSAVRC